MQAVDPTSMLLPPSVIPRPGERVRWYAEAAAMSGIVQGHSADGEAVIRNDFDVDSRREFGSIRLEDPFNRAKPNWFDLPAKARLVRPYAAELDRFRAAMDRRIPPGPKYKDLVEEIWGRGFEIFLVGGTVRDILIGELPNDIDFVTTMPLRQMLAFLHPMYRMKATGQDSRGYIRIGGSPATGDPFIDLKVFSNSTPGTKDATFGVGFARDLAFRDFACNAVYFDPKNEVLIDPSGHGIDDCGAKVLRLVCQSGNAHQMGQVFIRAVKFVYRGYTPEPETRQRLLTDYLPALAALQNEVRARYFITQVMSKHKSAEAKRRALDAFKVTLCDFGCMTVWEEFFEAKVEELLSDE